MECRHSSALHFITIPAYNFQLYLLIHVFQILVGALHAIIIKHKLS